MTGCTRGGSSKGLRLAYLYKRCFTSGDVMVLTAILIALSAVAMPFFIFCIYGFLADLKQRRRPLTQL
jgi:hypothetical protein